MSLPSLAISRRVGSSLAHHCGVDHSGGKSLHHDLPQVMVKLMRLGSLSLLIGYPGLKKEDKNVWINSIKSSATAINWFW